MAVNWSVVRTGATYWEGVWIRMRSEEGDNSPGWCHDSPGMAGSYTSLVHLGILGEAEGLCAEFGPMCGTNYTSGRWPKLLSRINYRAITVIMKEWDMGGENWLMQIRIGFPIMGRIRNAGIYPDGTDLPTNLSRKSKLRETAPQDGPNWKRSYVKMRIHKLFGTRFKGS